MSWYNIIRNYQRRVKEYEEEIKQHQEEVKANQKRLRHNQIAVKSYHKRKNEKDVKIKELEDVATFFRLLKQYRKVIEQRFNEPEKEKQEPKEVISIDEQR